MHLEYFSAQSNQFSGELPKSLSNSASIIFLNLRNNSLTGAIDLNCSAMVNLNSINLATNNFHGEIPENLPTCKNLRAVNFARINFHGKIPASFRNFHSLIHLSLSDSNVSDLATALDILQYCRSLKTLVLTGNFNGEEMPNHLDLHFVELKVLIVADCKLTGYIPQWLNQCRNLQLLDLSWNRLEGSIPTYIGDLRSLFYLDLSKNSLTGEIPKELTGMQSLINGSVLKDVSNPDFPLYSRRNRQGYKYKQIGGFPSTLSLGNNLLMGEIWPEFGNLKKLHVLDLKCNNLFGSIPGSLSEMRSLETLDLSFNNLTGMIPSSLSILSFLSTFSVAHNHLSGRIPTGGQFLTFNNSSFDGNSGLCGTHSSPCPDSILSPLLDHSRKPRAADNMVSIAMGVGIGLGFMLLLVFFVCLVVLRFSWTKAVDPINSARIEPRSYSEVVTLCRSDDSSSMILVDDLVKATNNFDSSNIIGCGGFGLVYKAEFSDGRKVAIKRLYGDDLLMDREFEAEVDSLSRARHPNLVWLQGYCRYKNDKLLIYPYMENGSLDYWLHEKSDGPSSLDWEKRLRIAQGAARGLAYLHESCEPRIIHRDIKSSNILLDGEFKPHLADFGLARLILPYETHVTTDLVGTLGYIPPEYGQASVATYKGDVYSFGVVLLELLTGKRPMDVCGPKESRQLVSWVIEMMEEGREADVFDPLIYGAIHAGRKATVLGIASICLDESPRLRPNAQQLASLLDNVESTSSGPSEEDGFS
ncbi:phytosulfokine receptor 1-like isoform X2 [Andrographis paniculata]|nr:phytosulfokine receptor 1-like isoform X2 [Andrographis paniculata]